MLLFVADIAMIANTERELGEALNVTETLFNNYHMKILQFSKNHENLYILRCILEQLYRDK